MTGPNASIVLFGGLSFFTCFVLQQLLERQFAVRGVVLSAFAPSLQQPSQEQPKIFQSKQPNVVELCTANNIPICYFTGQQIELTEFLSQLSSDIFLLACYPSRLPASIIQLACQECINIHPSILPRYRGADPIFWQLRNGETNTGVTLHQVTQKIDSGNILSVRQVQYPEGLRFKEIQQILLERAIDCLQQLLATPRSNWSFNPQEPGKATWNQAPIDSDYSFNTDISAETAFNFTRAYSGMGLPLRVIDDCQEYWIQDALRYGAVRAASKNNDKTSTVSIKFKDGFVEFLVE